jgi:ABC-type transporter Mla subunit MlaD
MEEKKLPSVVNVQVDRSHHTLLKILCDASEKNLGAVLGEVIDLGFGPVADRYAQRSQETINAHKRAEELFGSVESTQQQVKESLEDLKELVDTNALDVSNLLGKP